MILKPGILVLIFLILMAFVACPMPSGPTSPPKTAIEFQGAVQSGGSFAAMESTALTLSFNIDPTFITADSITLTGATKGALTGSGLTRSLAISDITVLNGATVSVKISCPPEAVPAGYAFAGATQTARVFRPTYVGMSFLGGKIGYLLKSGDPGYDANVSHGLIVAAADVSGYITWCKPAFTSTALAGTTGTAIGTGRANTDLIVAQNGPGTDYAAGIARAYTGGGYTDWYLPSQDELYAILTNKTLIGMNLSCYKSSSEHNFEQCYVVWQDLYLAYEYKSTGRNIRAIRDF